MHMYIYIRACPGTNKMCWHHNVSSYAGEYRISQFTTREERSFDRK